ncbi:TetR/AcrR family transcriptional regulator [Pasteuria penetrans]|uniref:TetR/AcrR family transcriptional regulator n=1 Tax=Pasteuria penetrans TaxID=86005 RepID=UPI001CAA8148|nr:TetR/AcrR family transcriptional regulator [Pasteuria penetrans]
MKTNGRSTFPREMATSPTTQRPMNRREDIVRMAAQLFSERGYHGTKVRDIAAACDLLSGSLYTHIRSKEELLFSICVQGAQVFLNRADPIVQSCVHPIKKLRLLLRTHVTTVAEERETATVFFHEWRALRNDHLQIVREYRNRYEGIWKSILREGVSQGIFLPTNNSIVCKIWLSVGNWTYQWYRADGPLNPAQLADLLADLLLQGMIVRRDQNSDSQNGNHLEVSKKDR